MNTMKIDKLVHDLRHNVDYSVDGLVSCTRSFIEDLANLIETMNNRIIEFELLNGYGFGSITDVERTLTNILDEVANE